MVYFPESQPVYAEKKKSFSYLCLGCFWCDCAQILQKHNTMMEAYECPFFFGIIWQTTLYSDERAPLVANLKTWL